MRHLTSEEIKDILDFIKPCPDIPSESARVVMDNNREGIRKQLLLQKVNPKIIPELKCQIKKMYFDSLIQAGESVGIICAQSIGEKQTQTTLNTFHKAGQSEKTMTAGVPRFQELINATKKPKNGNHRLFFNKDNQIIKQIRAIL